MACMLADSSSDACSWLYLSRLAAMKEYAFMVALGEHGLPVPYAVAHNRHCVLMTMVDAVPLVQVFLHWACDDALSCMHAAHLCNCMYVSHYTTMRVGWSDSPSSISREPFWQWWVGILCSSLLLVECICSGRMYVGKVLDVCQISCCYRAPLRSPACVLGLFSLHVVRVRRSNFAIQSNACSHASIQACMQALNIVVLLLLCAKSLSVGSWDLVCFKHNSRCELAAVNWQKHLWIGMSSALASLSSECCRSCANTQQTLNPQPSKPFVPHQALWVLPTNVIHCPEGTQLIITRKALKMFFNIITIVQGPMCNNRVCCCFTVCRDQLYLQHDRAYGGPVEYKTRWTIWGGKHLPLSRPTPGRTCVWTIDQVNKQTEK